MKNLAIASISWTLLSSAAHLACSSSPPPEPSAPLPAPPPAPADPEDVVIKGDHLEIRDHINFAFDSDEILDSSFELLDHVALLLSNHSEIASVDIVGHTDAAGGHEHNQELSERRAAAVVAALQARGVQQGLSSHGAGESEPVCSEDTDACHADNRRVEFKIAVNPSH